MQSKLELRYLVSFLAIAEELHFGRAAARLHLAQPSLSQQLQRLERAVGVELVSRTSHEVALTPAGRAFEREARRILDQAAHAVRVAREAASGRTGSISIGFNFPAGQRVLQPTLRRLNADYPNVSTRLMEAQTGTQLTALAKNKIDIAFIFPGPLASQWQSRRLTTERLVAFVGRDHPWAGRAAVPFRELADQRCVLFPRDESPGLYDAVTGAAVRSGIRLHIIEEAGAPAVIVGTRPVVGFTTVTRAEELSDRTYSVLRLVDPTPIVAIYAVWRPDPQPVLGAFLNSLEAAGPFGESVPAIAV
jgi:DNA-binding transcriptional LysR family regulator